MSRKRPFHRTDRLNSQIKEVLATTLMRESREAILRDIVITDVAVTSDVSLARCYWHALPGLAEADPEAVQEALERAAGFLRKKVGEVIRARLTPELRFIYDKTLDQGRRIDQIIHNLDIPAETLPSTEPVRKAAADDDEDEGDEVEDDVVADDGEAPQR